MPKIEVPEFICHSCRHRFDGMASFRGEYSIEYNEVKKIQLCSKCLRQTNALWRNEPKAIVRHIQEKIDYHALRHGFDRYADAKRTACEEILDLLTKQSVMFDGNNSKTGYRRDLNKLELMARKDIHEKFKINCHDQVQITVEGARFVVDGLIQASKRKEVVLEYDSDYYHSTEQQKERDWHKDYMLTEHGGYTVVRISEDIIKHDKGRFRSLVLDGVHGIKQMKSKVSKQLGSMN